MITAVVKTTEIDRGAAALEETLGQIGAYSATIGMWGEATNAFGERIMTYGSAQAGARGASPHWMSRALKAANAWARGAMPDVYDRILAGARDVPALIARVGQLAADKFRAQPAGAGLRKTGALIESIDWETPDRPHTVTAGGTRTRKRKAFASMSQAQQLYQMFHKGRSRSMRLMRQDTSFAKFRGEHQAKWAGATKDTRAATRREIVSSARRSGLAGQAAAADRTASAARRASMATRRGRR